MEKKIFGDEKWTKKDYLKTEAWAEVQEKVALISEAVSDHEDLAHLEGQDLARAVARQVALAVYDCLTEQVLVDEGDLMKFTRSQQSHWNFMLLGQLDDPWWSAMDTQEADRKQQPFTGYFLAKMIHRLHLLKVSVWWEGIQAALEEGKRWRVLASPASGEPRKKFKEWQNEFPEEAAEWPSPWKIANQFKVTVDHSHKPVEVDVSMDWTGKGEFAPKHNETTRTRLKKVWPCRLQYDGIMVIDAELMPSSSRVWVLNGIDPMEGWNEGDDQTYEIQMLQEKLADAQDEIKRLKNALTESEAKEFGLDLEVHGLRNDLEETREQLKAMASDTVEIRMQYNPKTGRIHQL